MHSQLALAESHVHKNSWYDGTEKKDQPGYTTHIITRNSVRFIEENKSRPFFLLVAHEAVHLPLQTPDDTPENRKPIPKGERWSRARIRPTIRGGAPQGAPPFCVLRLPPPAPRPGAGRLWPGAPVQLTRKFDRIRARLTPFPG